MWYVYLLKSQEGVRNDAAIIFVTGKLQTNMSLYFHLVCSVPIYIGISAVHQLTMGAQSLAPAISAAFSSICKNT